MSSRFPDWRERLAAFVLERRDAGFVWGARDCAMFAADAIQAMTGDDVLAAWRGAYSSRFGALRALKRAGFDTLAELFDARLFRRSGAPRAGDLICFHDGPLNTSLIADGRGGAWGQEEAGARRVSLVGGFIGWGV